MPMMTWELSLAREIVGDNTNLPNKRSALDECSLHFSEIHS